jgi:NADH:ubiquinone oxidoreductase subunit E
VKQLINGYPEKLSYGEIKALQDAEAKRHAELLEVLEHIYEANGEVSQDVWNLVSQLIAKARGDA